MGREGLVRYAAECDVDDCGVEACRPGNEDDDGCTGSRGGTGNRQDNRVSSASSSTTRFLLTFPTADSNPKATLHMEGSSRARPGASSGVKKSFFVSMLIPWKGSSMPVAFPFPLSMSEPSLLRLTRQTPHTPDSCPINVRAKTPERALKICMRELARPTTTHSSSDASDVTTPLSCD